MSQPSTARKPDAIALLKADHKLVKDLFKQAGKLKDGQEKNRIVQKICDELTVHTAIEEEIFYPAVRAAIDDEDLMDEADIEHAGAKELIAQLRKLKPGDDHYDARVTVLGEQIDHHVKEEHEEMFPKARKSDVDLKVLGDQLRQRKAELTASK
jgi:hemerythrin superfamily protein